MTRNRERGSRAPNGASTIYYSKYDDRWHGRVTVGVKDDGTPDRRHVKRKKEADVIRAVRELEKLREQGNLRKSGRAWTVEQWLTHWVENISAPTVRPNTADGYRFAIYKHLIPGVGSHRIDRLEPEHLEKLYTRMMRNGSAAGTAHQAHRTMRTALNEAVRRGHIGRNPAVLAKPPRLTDEEIEPLTIAEAQRVLATAACHRNSARWAVALSLGLRQGEALGLKWTDVDLASARLTVRRNRLRPTWTHGCGGGCGRKPGYCPQRNNTRPDTAETKSRAGRRSIGLPPQVVHLFRAHQAEQERERLAARQLWHDGGWLFADPTGNVLNPRTDTQNWKDLLKAAGVRDARLHDARHTAATVLLLLGVPERAAMEIMGWSHSAMAARYQHLTGAIRDDIASRVGGLLWGPTETQTETPQSAPGPDHSDR
ncbi:MAG: tyrosine-type recombinase/integrase [Pseudonocardiaceae bacterium]